MPVPYLTLWSSEVGIRVARCGYVSDLATFPARGARGDGVPIFTKTESSRQRECMVGRFCQVCRSPVYHIGWLACIPASDVSPSGETLIRQPWLCAGCLAYSIAVCPRIVLRDREHPALEVQVIGGIVRARFQVAVIARTPALVEEAGVVEGDWMAARDQVKVSVIRANIRLSGREWMARFAPRDIRDWLKARMAG